MTVQEMKYEIRKVYDTATWKYKVDHMYDDQIIAIYHNFNERGVLGKVLRKERPTFVAVTEPPKTKKERLKEAEKVCQQLTIFGFIN